ncbi:MAG: hypothetical protein ACT4PK_09440 [Gammaproteobacteria bacterium]
MTDPTPLAVPSQLDVLRRSLPTRLKAAGIHLGLSAVVFAVALYLILVEWYPGFHFLVDGGWRGVKIMAGVDLVLGPTLTLIIFNPFKARRLIVLDLACIAIVQVGALVWGFYAVHSQRPVAVSYYEGAFLSLTAEPLAIEKKPADFARQFSSRRPPLVYVRPPVGDEEGARAALQELFGKVAFHEDPFFFDRLEPHWSEVRGHGRTAGQRAKEHRGFGEALPGFLARHGGAAADYVFFPYEGRDGNCTVAFRGAGELVGALACESY